MSAHLSLSAYRDCFEVLERALDSPRGIRVRVEGNNAAVVYRLRLNMARQLDRARAKAMDGSALSEFDNLVFTIEDDDKGWWVRIQPRSVPDIIEEIAAE